MSLEDISPTQQTNCWATGVLPVVLRTMVSPLQGSIGNAATYLEAHAPSYCVTLFQSLIGVDFQEFL